MILSIENNFFNKEIDNDIFEEKTYISFQFKIKFKIIEDNNKYLLYINYIYKNILKEVNKEVKEKLINLFPLNIKEIQSLNIEDYKLYTEYIGNFIINYCQEDNQFDIYLDILD
jgi:hypothetical protein